MDSTPPTAESLPALYRSILDLVAELERRGRRTAAVRIRAEASTAYSTAWDEAGRRRLLQLHARASRLLQGSDERTGRGRGWPRFPAATRLPTR